MSSLSSHLRLPEDHSRLPFHPACPVCRRDRLAGSLDGEELVSRRTQAAIAAGLLAFSSVAVPAAVAQEPDSISEGTAEVVDGEDSELDLGMETPQLPDEPAPTTDLVAAGTDEDAGPLELEPATDVREPVMDVNEAVAPAPAEPTPVPPPETVAPPPTDAAAEAAPPVETAAPSAPPESPIKAEATQRRKAPETVPEPRPEQPPTAEPAPAAPIVAAEPAPATPIPAAEPAPAPPTTVRIVARSSGSRAAPGDRSHVVRPGESLWSIAADLLGDRATVARVAREVDRLWELNDERIRTGDPDLLFAGTRLMLR